MERRDVCLRYATSILDSGIYMSELLRERLDLTRGRFETTADFTARSDTHWEMTPGGRADNMRLEDPSAEGGWRSEPNVAVAEKLAPWLAQEGHLLIVEQWFPEPWAPIGPSPEPLRTVQRRAEQMIEVYLLLAAPEARIDRVLAGVRAMGTFSREIGALVEYDTSDLPEDGAWIDERFLSDVLTNVICVFMRQTSFDAHLLWWKE